MIRNRQLPSAARQRRPHLAVPRAHVPPFHVAFSCVPPSRVPPSCVKPVRLKPVRFAAVRWIKAVRWVKAVCRMAAVCWVAAVASEGTVSPLSAAEKRPKVDFGGEVLPLLRGRCFACHAGREASSGYQLDVRVELIGESTGKPLVVPGDSRSSRLTQVITEDDPKRRMPPPEAGPALKPAEIAILRDWIDQGLNWDDNLLPPPAIKSDHWSFQTPVRPAIPLVACPPAARPPATGAAAGPAIASHDVAAWSRSPIDVFIAVEHLRQGLVPVPPADRRRLLRRLAFDLTGLPPDADWLEEFAADAAPDHVARAVDRLLASPRYGERWGRHWLDVARWAESEGFESNHPRPYAWRYRDYVVDSFNRDLPFDQFLREQIAGDELSPYQDHQLIATGFLAAARLSSNEEDKALQRNDVLVDIVNMVGEAVLGLTVGCAQCHNHKFDPLTQRDYYRLQALFVNGQPANLALRDPELNRRYEEALPAALPPARHLASVLFEAARERLRQDRLSKLSTESRTALATPANQRTAAQHELARQADLQLQLLDNQIEREIAADDKSLYDSLKKKIAALEKQVPDRPQTWGFYSPRTSPTGIDVLPMRGFYPLEFDAQRLRESQAFLLVRGNVHQPGPVVEPGWPAALELTVETSQPIRHVGSRLAFVDWLVDPRHPLTARVWANRVWQQHFGRGLVETSGDFGLRGAPPTHPRLLDYLAVEGREQGWSTKYLHRMICTSSVYALGTEPGRASAAVGESAKGGGAAEGGGGARNGVGDGASQPDAENRWLWRFPARRLEAEAVRDALLAVAGELDLAVGGPSGDESSSRRRALYLFQKRDLLPEVQRLFDGANANEPCGRRLATTVSLQPLYLLNSPFAARMAERFAARVHDAAGDDPGRQAQLAYRWALGRAPDAAETAASLAFLAASSAPRAVGTSNSAAAEAGTASWPPLRRFCQVLMNLNEFVYLE